MTRRLPGRLVAWLVAGGTLLLLLAPAAPAQATTVISFEPAAVDLAAGESTQITVAITAASAAYGFETHITFDPAILQVVDQDPEETGTQIMSGGFFDENEGFLITNQADNTTGQIDYALTLLAPAPPKDGDGALLFLTFRAMRAGQGQVVLDSATLASTDGDPLPFTVENGQVNIVGEANPTAAPSAPIATNTAPPAAVPPTETEPAPTEVQTMVQTPGGTLEGLSPTGTGSAITASATAVGVHPPVTGTPAIEPPSTDGGVVAASETPAAPPATPWSTDMPTGTPGAAAAAATVPPSTRTVLPAPTIVAGQPSGDEGARSGLAAGWLWAAGLLVVVALSLAAGFFLRLRDPGAGG